MAIGSKQRFRLFSCARCQTIFADETGGEEGKHDYADYYDAHNLRVPGFVNERIRDIVADFEPYRRQNRLLDIGFGAGAFLQGAAGAGWNATGIEVSEPACRHARSLGLEVFHGELSEAHYPNEHFDVIVASEILEHVAQPKPLMREVARILRPGGLFWATTPHGHGLSFRLIGLRWSIVAPPEHLQLFSLCGMRQLLADAGFRRIRLRTRGLNPLELIHVLSAGGSTGTARTEVNGDVPPVGKTFDRVNTSYRLNAFLTRNSVTRVLKDVLNGVLTTLRIGDTLQVHANR
jgi:SAM-dependent methyltransferase